MKLSTYINSASEDTSPDQDNDMLLEYDASAGGCKKVKVNTIYNAGGWITADAMTYASADAPTFTMTCSGDLTGKYCPGMRIKLTQTTVKYFIITAVSYGAPNTTITLYGGTDYTLANAAITLPYFSNVKAPMGFPLDPIKWTVEVSDTSLRTQATPANGTWYNIGTVTISIPIGSWKVMYEVVTQLGDATSGFWNTYVTLSTANNSQSDASLTSYCASQATVLFAVQHRREKFLTLASKTSYYLNTMTNQTGLDNFYNRGDQASTIIRATCAYL